VLKTVAGHYLTNVVTVDGWKHEFASTVLTSYSHGTFRYSNYSNR